VRPSEVSVSSLVAEPFAPTLYSARFLDGQTPQPVQGHVTLHDDTIRFVQSNVESLTFAIDRIDRTEVIGGELHILFKPDMPGSPAGELVVFDVTFGPILDNARRLHTTGFATHLKVLLQRMSLRGWIAAAVVVIPLGYFLLTNVVVAGHVFVSVDTERALGEMFYNRIESKWTVCSNHELQLSVQTLVEQLADPQSNYRYQVTIFDSEDANAFALPGGRILILSGLFKTCESPEGLAGVLAHEIAHVEKRHGLKQLLRSAGVLAFMSMAVGGGVDQLEVLETLSELSSLLLIVKYSRALETEADEQAVKTLHRNHLSVQGLSAFFRVMQQESFLGNAEKALAWISTHPLTESRIELLEEAVASEPTDWPASKLLDALGEQWSSPCLQQETEEKP